MNSALIEQAHKVIPDTALLINAVSQRVSQLTQGFSPLIKIDRSKHGEADIALMEIIQGKISIGGYQATPAEPTQESASTADSEKEAAVVEETIEG